MKYYEMTAPQLVQVDRDQTVAIVPIAAVEQHGPHMPTGTDTILCGAVADAIEQRMPSRVIVTPTLWLGASSHHLRLGATLNATLATYVETLCDISRSLLNDGFQRILLLNGHGGNIDPMRLAMRTIQPEYPNALLAAGSYWSSANTLIDETLSGDHKYVGHACEFETSMMLHVRPELVDDALRANAGHLVPDNLDGVFLARDMRQRTREGCTGRPDLATAEKGKLLLDGIVNRLVATLETLLEQPLGGDYQDFVR
jgi:creatinine amidohydrolase